MRVAEFERPCDPKKSALGHHEKNQVKLLLIVFT